MITWQRWVYHNFMSPYQVIVPCRSIPRTNCLRTPLHTPLRLVGEWEVSLVEINYPRTWYNISGDTCKIKYRSTELGELESISIAPGYYEDAEQIIDEIKKNLSENARRSILMYVKRQSRKMIISCQNGSSIVINEAMAQMLGYEKSGLFRKDNFGSYPVDVHRGFYTFYLYTDIVPICWRCSRSVTENHRFRSYKNWWYGVTYLQQSSLCTNQSERYRNCEN